MYLGWNFSEKILRSGALKPIETGFSLLSQSVIWLSIESLITKVEGEKLNDAPGEFGAGFPQFNKQHNCAALMDFTG